MQLAAAARNRHSIWETSIEGRLESVRDSLPGYRSRLAGKRSNQSARNLLDANLGHAAVHVGASFICGLGTLSTKHNHAAIERSGLRWIGRPEERDTRFIQRCCQMKRSAVDAHHCSGATSGVDQSGKRGRMNADIAYSGEFVRAFGWSVDHELYAFLLKELAQTLVMRERRLLAAPTGKRTAANKRSRREIALRRPLRDPGLVRLFRTTSRADELEVSLHTVRTGHGYSMRIEKGG